MSVTPPLPIDETLAALVRIGEAIGELRPGTCSVLDQLEAIRATLGEFDEDTPSIAAQLAAIREKLDELLALRTFANTPGMQLTTEHSVNRLAEYDAELLLPPNLAGNTPGHVVLFGPPGDAQSVSAQPVTPRWLSEQSATRLRSIVAFYAEPFVGDERLRLAMTADEIAAMDDAGELNNRLLKHLTSEYF